jgi:hydrogenase-4 component E
LSTVAIVSLVALGFGVILVRRRSLATWLLVAQSLLLGVVALTLADGSSGLAVAGTILLVRAFALPALLVLTRQRTPEPGPVTPTTTVVVRLLVAALVSLAAVASLPPLGLADVAAERGAVTLLCLGIAIVIMRRPALVQVLGILVAENGVYLLAVSVPGGLPLVIELGVVFDLALVITVAAAFAQKIHGALGSGDTDLMRQLHD